MGTCSEMDDRIAGVGTDPLAIAADGDRLSAMDRIAVARHVASAECPQIRARNIVPPERPGARLVMLRFISCRSAGKQKRHESRGSRDEHERPDKHCGRNPRQIFHRPVRHEE